MPDLCKPCRETAPGAWMSAPKSMEPRTPHWLAGPATALVAIIFSAMLGVLYGFGVYLFSMLLPDMKSDLAFSYTGAGWITGLSHIGYLIGSVLAAPLALRFGGGRVLIFSVWFSAAALLGLSLAQTGWIISILLGVGRMCQSLAWVPVTGLVAEHVNPRYRSMVLALTCSGASYFMIMNGYLVPYLLHHHGWRSVWLVCFGITALAALTGWHWVRRLGMMKRAGSAGGAATGSGPTLPVSLLIRRHWRILILFALAGLGYWPYAIYLSPYIRDELGLGLAAAQELWTVVGAAGLTAGLILGFISDRLGLRTGMSVVYVLSFTAGLVMCFPQMRWLFPLSAASFGISVASIFALHPAYLTKTVSPKESNQVTGAGCLVLGLSSIASSYLAGWSQGISGTFFWAFAATAVIAAAALCFTWLLPSERQAA